MMLQESCPESYSENTHPVKVKGRWMQDLVQYIRSDTYFFYLGGESGRFISVEANGVCRIGTYAGAVLHIGDALLATTHRKKYPDQKAALRRVYDIIPELCDAPLTLRMRQDSEIPKRRCPLTLGYSYRIERSSARRFGGAAADSDLPIKTGEENS